MAERQRVVERQRMAERQRLELVAAEAIAAGRRWLPGLA